MKYIHLFTIEYVYLGFIVRIWFDSSRSGGASNLSIPHESTISNREILIVITIQSLAHES